MPIDNGLIDSELVKGARGEEASVTNSSGRRFRVRKQECGRSCARARRLRVGRRRHFSSAAHFRLEFGRKAQRFGEHKSRRRRDVRREAAARNFAQSVYRPKSGGTFFFSKRVETRRQSAAFLQLDWAIQRIRYQNGATNTGQALQFVLESGFQGARGGSVPKAVLVVTDGQSQDDVAEASQRLRDAHVMVYAIGVTNLVNVHQLHQVRARAHSRAVRSLAYASFVYACFVVAVADDRQRAACFHR